jgi:arrestin-2
MKADLFFLRLRASLCRFIELYYVSFIFLWFFPGSSDSDKAANAKKNKGADRASYENSHFAADDDDNIVFEDFARLRLNEPDE